MALDWSILRTNEPVDIAGNFARGYQVATTLIDKIHERNALGTLAQTPNDPSALATLYQVNPTLADHFETRGKELAQTQRRAALAQQYAGGDTSGARTAALGAGDFDLAKQFGDLDELTQKRAVDFWEKAGPIAYSLRQIKDPVARQVQWASDKALLMSEGVNTDLLNRFDPLNEQQLNSAITTSQKVSELFTRDKPDYRSVEAGGSLIDVSGGHPRVVIAPNDGSHPVGASADGALPLVHDKAGYDALPPGAHFLDPDGHMRVKGGQSGGGSAGGFSMTNNPGALRKPGSMEFQRFNSPQEGIAAQQALLGRYMGRGLTNVSAIVERYAPRQSAGGDNSDASVNNYIRYVSRRLGVNPQDSLSPAMLPMLSQAMREFETGKRVD